MSIADVLIVDGKSDRFALRCILQREGVDALEAVDGPSALAIARAQNPLSVIVGLPGAEGLELIDRLLSERRDTAVVVVAHRDAMTDIAKALHHGAWDFAVKPYADVATLISTVSRARRKATFQRHNRRAADRLRLIARHLNAALTPSPEHLEPRAPARYHLPPPP